MAQLEQWARDQNLEDNGTRVIDTLLPVIQATQLLQARKTEEDVTGICEMCDKLRVSQIIKILNLYTPADEFEERVSPAFVRKIQNKLQERSMEEAKNQVSANSYFNFIFLESLHRQTKRNELKAFDLLIPDYKCKPMCSR